MLKRFVSLQNYLSTPLRSDRGATAVEYGLLVALISSWNGLTVRMGDDASRLLARAFVDGTLAIMLTSVLLSLAL